jgi:hypothetical protein
MVWKPDYVVLADAKKWVRINDVIDDTELAVIITAACQGINDHCHRQFGKTAGAEERFYTAWFDSERWRWVVDVDDFMSAAGLVVTIGGVAATGFTKEPVNAAAEGMPWTSLSWDARTAAVLPTGAEFEVSVTANPFGWTAVPASVTLGARLQISRFLARRDSPYGIAGSNESQLRLLSHLDPDVSVSLRGLVRPLKVG